MQHFHVVVDGKPKWCVDGVEAAAIRAGFERTHLIEDLERGCDKKVGCRSCPWHLAALKAAEVVSASVLVPMTRAQLRLRQTPHWVFPNPAGQPTILEVAVQVGSSLDCLAQAAIRDAQRVAIGLVSK